MAVRDTMTFVINDTSTGGSTPQCQVTIMENGNRTLRVRFAQLGGAGAGV